MRAVVQRVLQAHVKVTNQSVAAIEKGLLVYISVARTDSPGDAKFIADKLVNLRIFPDQAGKMNLSVVDIGGAILLVSNFTLHGDFRKGRRPAFDAAAQPELAKKLYEHLAELIAEHGVNVEKGIFREHMHVHSINDGPVNFLLDSSRLF